MKKSALQIGTTLKSTYLRQAIFSSQINVFYERFKAANTPYNVQFHNGSPSGVIGVNLLLNSARIFQKEHLRNACDLVYIMYRGKCCFL